MIIWNYAFPQRRLIRVTSSEEHSQHDDWLGGIWNELRLKPVISLRHLNLLGTCYEARKVALSLFPPRLKYLLQQKPRNLNYESDVVYFKNEKAISAFRTFSGPQDSCDAAKDELKHFQQNIRHVAFGGPSWKPRALAFVCTCEDLSEVIVEQPAMSRIRNIHHCGSIQQFQEKIIKQLSIAWAKKWAEKKPTPRVVFKSWKEIEDMDR